MLDSSQREPANRPEALQALMERVRTDLKTSWAARERGRGASRASASLKPRRRACSFAQPALDLQMRHGDFNAGEQRRRNELWRLHRQSESEDVEPAVPTSELRSTGRFAASG
jgi:hypothetical protein